jgi:endonuclease/exonuclease/phosphatase family metal-dependent hydrolase
MTNRALPAAIFLLAFSMIFGHLLKPGTAAPAITPEPVPNSISVVTLNLAKETDVDKIIGELDAVQPVRQADVFLFQEVAQHDGQPKCVAEQLAGRLGMQVVYSPSATGVTDQGLAILSRYPLEQPSVRALKAYDLRFRSRSRIALSVTADTPAGLIRLHNAHLDTRLNLSDRLAQLAPVVEDDQFSGPRLVGGDFNTNDFYWVGRVMPVPFIHSQTDGMSAFMSRHGFANPVPLRGATFDYAGMHLDWMFAKGLKPRGTVVYPLKFSDHHAVLVRFVRNATAG